MLRLAIKFLDFAFKHNGSFHNPYFVCRTSGLYNFKGISIVNLSKFSTQTSNEPKSADILRIYEGPLAPRLKTVKILSLSTSLVALAGYPILAEKMANNPEKLGQYLALTSVITFFSFVTPAMLQFMALKYIVAIDYNPSKDRYTLYRYSLFLKLVSVDFAASDVCRVTKPLATVSILGRGYLLDPNSFNDLEHYKRMVGFDKELDIRIESSYKTDNAEEELKRPEIPEFDYQTSKRDEQVKNDELGVPINLRKKNR